MIDNYNNLTVINLIILDFLFQKSHLVYFKFLEYKSFSLVNLVIWSLFVNWSVLTTKLIF